MDDGKNYLSAAELFNFRALHNWVLQMISSFVSWISKMFNKNEFIPVKKFNFASILKLRIFQKFSGIPFQDSIVERWKKMLKGKKIFKARKLVLNQKIPKIQKKKIKRLSEGLRRNYVNWEIPINPEINCLKHTGFTNCMYQLF